MSPPGLDVFSLRDVVLADYKEFATSFTTIHADDIRQQVEVGASHITFGDPDFLNGPGHAVAVARALHAEFPSVTRRSTLGTVTGLSR